MIIFMVLSACLKHCESSPGSCDECAKCQVTADLWIKPIGLSHKPACRLSVNYTHHHHFIITQPES